MDAARWQPIACSKAAAQCECPVKVDYVIVWVRHHPALTLIAVVILVGVFLLAVEIYRGFDDHLRDP
jgi:hypothetical protein